MTIRAGLLALGATACATPASLPSNTPTTPGRAPYLVAELGGVRALALDADHVYFLQDAAAGGGVTIGRVARRGGKVAEIATATAATALAVTPRFVWWLDDGVVVRVEKGRKDAVGLTTHAEHVDALAGSGDDVWIAGRVRSAGERLLAFDDEAGTTRDVAAFPGNGRPYGFAAGDGQVVAAVDSPAFVALRDGRFVDVVPGTAGPTLAVADRRMLVGGLGLTVYPLDGRPRQQVSEMRDAALTVIVGGGRLGGGPPGPDRIEQHEVLLAVAGGSGRLVVAAARAEYRIPQEICNSCFVTHRLLDGSGSIAVVTPAGTLSFVTLTEAVPRALAVDAHGVVWATGAAIRAANF